MNYEKILTPIRGKVRRAVYVQQQIPAYIGNPLVEALPRILSVKEAMKKLAHYPHFDESMRSFPDEQRAHMLEDIVRFFTPLNIHIDLERRISRVIRTGLIERNPMKNNFWQENLELADAVNENSISQYGDDDDFHSTSAYGFNLVGVSGIGKSLAIERVLRLYPQIIHHSKYKEKNFTFSQIVWLKLDCPFDGSIKGLCINFFQTVDSILGTSYHKNYGSKSRNTDEMMPYMALVAANHGIGVLVIDEIQRLSLTKSGGTEKMLNFFVQLVNTVGVPVILVGTYKSLSVFDGNFSQLRRGTGQGDLVWDRMKRDKEWKLFVSALWHFQYTQKTCSLIDKPELIDILYEETQGITDLAVKAYMLAQERAIDTKEMITASIIRSVCRDKFRMLQPAIEALKSKTKNALERFEDAYPQFLEQFIENSACSNSNSANTIQVEGEIASDPIIRSVLKRKKRSKKSNQPSQKEEFEAMDEKSLSLINLETWLEEKENVDAVSSSSKETVLPKILTSLKEVDSKTIHTALKEKGFIKSGVEFMSGGNAL